MTETKEKLCTRCGYLWVSNKINPKACPRCKSYTWNKRKQEVDVNERKQNDQVVPGSIEPRI